MKELSDIIEFENENTSLDFKAIQYKKEQFESFLKDIISLANAVTKEDKYIVVGVKYQANGNRDIIGINEEFIDEATYQQIIHNNIEPELTFEYYPFEFKTKKLGIFHLKDISNPPYMMKKDFGKLKLGDCFIRKGSHQTKLSRRDLDTINSNRISENNFEGKIKFSFLEFEDSTDMTIEQTEKILPSDKAVEKIKKIISQKEYEENYKPTSLRFAAPRLGMLGNSSYEERDLSTLRENLSNVKLTYKYQDRYYIYEESAHKINFFIFNKGKEYIEDASVEITIKKNDKILVRSSIFPKPETRSSFMQISTPNPGPTFENLNYPDISGNSEEFKIFQTIGNIKHQIPQRSLKVPFRLVLMKNCVNDVLNLQVKLFGKNLREPICETLTLSII